MRVLRTGLIVVWVLCWVVVVMAVMRQEHTASVAVSTTTPAVLPSREDMVGFEPYDHATTGSSSVFATTTTPPVPPPKGIQSLLEQVATVTRSVKNLVTKNTTPPKSPVTPVPNPAPKPTPVVTPTPKATTPPSTGLDYRFGIAAGETLSVLSEADLAHRLDNMADMGVGWIRADLAWSSIQQNGPDQYYWDNFDRVVRLAHDRGIRVLPIITYTPRWARSDECPDNKKCRPRDPAEYARFAKAAVERYAPRGVRTWEVWNEPNLGIFWGPTADAGRYTEILKAAYDAIHAADSGATVISGGLAPTSTGGRNVAPRQYLEEMYAHGAKGHFDAVGFHPYSFPLSPSFYNKTNAWSQMADTEWSIRSIMAANGDSGKKIWLTEYGAPTGGPGDIANSNDDRGVWDNPDHVTESYQATILKEAIQQSRTYSWAGPLFWYSYKDLGTESYTKENFFGLIRYDGTPKPAFNTLQDLL